ncbi:hypothetical protein OS493_002649 [Desmophyllum pertusum]|uniref:Uncharacterized protein n=1 Tax=Desmophyllum pertusum TaxID=174260 RepID=A0A9W9YW30_9CNID|nr:hypothetical protein OS493_002649 [Desmophyllum pertusum]
MSHLALLALFVRAEKELNPWIRIELPRNVFIYKVQLYGSHDQDRKSLFLVYVVLSNVSDSIVKCNRSRKRAGMVFECVPPVNGEAVRVSLEGNSTLVICDVFISGIESQSDTNGVLREVWNMLDDDFEEMDEVQSWHVTQTLDAPENFDNFYLQKLSTYFQECELWLHKMNTLNSTKTKLLKLTEPTLDWNSRPNDQRSKVLNLSECYFYKLEACMANGEAVGDHLSVGVRLPNGEIQKPISGQHLYWMKPGEGTLKIRLNRSDSSENLITEVGSTFILTGSYKYCCHGVFCPNCNLNLSLLNVHPGKYKIQANYSLVDKDGHATPMQRQLTNIFVKVSAAVLYNCKVWNSSFCKWSTNGREENNEWLGGAFHFVGNEDVRNVSLQSAPLPWKQAYSNLQTCLQFKYNISTINVSSFSLNVSVLRSNGEKSLIWSIHGYQDGQSAKCLGNQNKTTRSSSDRVVIYDVRIITSSCGMQPAFAKPAFRKTSTSREFQCVDGSFVPWSKTCKDSTVCQDESHKPSICDSKQWPLNNLRCLNQTSDCSYPHRDGCEKGEELSYWNSTNGPASWKFLSFNEANKLEKQIRQQELQGTQPNKNDQLIIKGVYELRFDDKFNDVTIHDWLQRDLMSATLCAWIRTKRPGLHLTYKRKMECDGTILIQLLIEDALLRTTVHGNEWNISAALVDDKWHHVCISWQSKDLRIYIDGQMKQNVESGDSVFDLSMRGGGDLDLGFTKARDVNGINGRISGLNVWDHVIESKEIRRMSLGCANETGNAESWKSLISATSLQYSAILNQSDLSCQDREGNRLVLNSTNQTTLNARLMSPWFNRSAAGHGKCVKFRFMFVGHGARSLHFVQKTFKNLAPTPIWAEHRIGNVDSLWQYGQVSITGTKKHQLFFEGKLDSKHGYIAVGGLYVTPGYCAIQPPNANRGCNITLENKTSGWILSPQYPGYYTNNASCQWHLTVPPGHVIRLEFLYFDLEFRWHPWYRCSDFVEIHDGLSRSNCTYCVLPTTITSSGREMLINI